MTVQSLDISGDVEFGYYGDKEEEIRNVFAIDLTDDEVKAFGFKYAGDSLAYRFLTASGLTRYYKGT